MDPSIVPCLLSLLGLCLPGNGAALGVADDEPELLLVQIVSRHGLRSPEFPYPKDLYSDESKYWPNGWGQLTELGKEQELDLGKFLRKRYGDFISSTYFPKEVKAISSDYDRTIQSAQLVLAGLFSSNNALDVNSFIPVHSISKEVDRMINPFPNCPRGKKDYEDYKKSDVVMKYNEKHEAIFDDLREKMGYGPNVTSEVYNGIGSLAIYRTSNLTLPSWATKLLDSEEIMGILSEGFRFLTGTEKLKRLTGGPILTELVNNMGKKINGSLNQKLFLYLGHDMTISAILNTLGAFDTHWPTFSASLFIELFRKNSTGEHIIQINYKNSTTGEDVHEVNLPKCPRPCTLEKFTSEFHQFLPTSLELDKECQLSPTYPISTLDAILIGLIIVLVLLIFILLICYYCRSSNKDYQINA